MANFTDTSQAYITPYTPKYDLGLYASVGQHKQSQYDLGIQRVQSAIDSVAGLDIYRPVDKQYLQGKLGELSTNLQGVVGGDYSNQSIVNQAMGMASKLYKDPNIQAAVISTQNIKQLMSDQKEVKEKHPELYNTQNEWFDNREITSYLSNNEVGKSYNGPKSATRYNDYQKPLNELLKQVSPDVTVQFSPDGAYQFKSEKSSIVNPEKLHAIVDGYLSAHPEAMHQVGIDALYNYKDYTPASFALHTSNYAASSIKELQAINEQYQKQIDANPNALDFIRDKQKAMADNMLAANRIAQNRDNYLSLIQSGNFDGAKIALFSDNMKGMYSTTYQKDNIERDIKENYNAVQGQTFGIDKLRLQKSLLESGLELDANGNMRAIDPNSPNYAAYAATMRANGKDPMGRKITGLTGTGGTGNTEVISENPKDATFGRSEYQRQVNELTNDSGTGVIDEYTRKFKDSYIDGLADKGSLSNEQKNAKFKEFLDKQEQLFAEGSPDVDPYYKDYKRFIRPYQTKLDGLLTVNEEAKKYAADKVPMEGIDMELIKAAKDLYSKAFDQATKATQGNAKIDNYDPYINAYAGNLLAQYSNSPYRDQLASMVKGGFTNSYNKLLKPVDQKVNQRLAEEDAYMKEHGKGFNLEMNRLQGDEEEMNSYRTAIYSALSSNKGRGENNSTTYNLEKYKVKDVEPIGVYKRADGKSVYRFKLGKNEVDDVVSSSTDNLVPNADPNDWLVRNIELTGRTPATGKGVLTSYDGKIRYQIIKHPYKAGTYDVALIENGQPIKIQLRQSSDPNAPFLQPTSPTVIMDAMEKLSNSINPFSNPPRSFTRDEIIYLYTPGHTNEDFKAYMDAKSKAK